MAACLHCRKAAWIHALVCCPPSPPHLTCVVPHHARPNGYTHSHPCICLKVSKHLQAPAENTCTAWKHLYSLETLCSSLLCSLTPGCASLLSLLLVMVQDIPEHPVGSQHGSWGTRVIQRIRTTVTIASIQCMRGCFEHPRGKCLLTCIRVVFASSCCATFAWRNSRSMFAPDVTLNRVDAGHWSGTASVKAHSTVQQSTCLPQLLT
jgi:hypothetical protein